MLQVRRVEIYCSVYFHGVWSQIWSGLAWPSSPSWGPGKWHNRDACSSVEIQPAPGMEALPGPNEGAAQRRDPALHRRRRLSPTPPQSSASLGPYRLSTTTNGSKTAAISADSIALHTGPSAWPKLFRSDVFQLSYSVIDTTNLPALGRSTPDARVYHALASPAERRRLRPR